MPPQWKDKRARILRRDRHICHLCGQPGATEVDHLIPGDDHRDSNLAAAHPACHARKSGQEGARVRNQPRFY